MPRPRNKDKELQKEVGVRLAAARRARGWSQERLAEVLGVQPETVSRYETGAVPMSIAVLVRVAAALEVSPTVLLPPTTSGQSEPAELLRAWELLDDEARAAVLVVLHRAISR